MEERPFVNNPKGFNSYRVDPSDINHVYVDYDGQEGVVDQDGLQRLLRFNRHWYVGVKGYVQCTIYVNGKRVCLRLHHFIAGKPKPGHVIDHENTDKLDNRFSNLREVDSCVNAQNYPATLRLSKSGYRNVKYDTKSGLWYASIKHHRKVYNSIGFTSAEQANECAICMREMLGRTAKVLSGNPSA